MVLTSIKVFASGLQSTSTTATAFLKLKVHEAWNDQWCVEDVRYATSRLVFPWILKLRLTKSLPTKDQMRRTWYRNNADTILHTEGNCGTMCRSACAVSEAKTVEGVARVKKYRSRVWSSKHKEKMSQSQYPPPLHILDKRISENNRFSPGAWCYCRWCSDRFFIMFNVLVKVPRSLRSQLRSSTWYSE